MGERGSILLGTLFLAVMVALALGSLMYKVENTRQNNVRAGARTAAIYAQSALQMMLSKSATCNANLTDAFFGTTLAEIEARSTANTLRISLPGLSAGSPAVVTAGSVFSRMTIRKLSFGAPVQEFPGDLAYVADLTVEATPFGASAYRSFVIPFYFLTDSSGLLTECFASVRANAYGTNDTLETEICRHWYGPTFKYRYDGRFCSEVTP